MTLIQKSKKIYIGIGVGVAVGVIIILFLVFITKPPDNKNTTYKPNIPVFPLFPVIPTTEPKNIDIDKTDKFLTYYDTKYHDDESTLIKDYDNALNAYALSFTQIEGELKYESEILRDINPFYD